MIITLPFPPAILSPNRGDHWSQKSPVKSKYRHDCKLLALASGYRPPAGKIHLDVVFYPPRNIGDIDNFFSSMKSGIDGLADAWQVNDRLFRPITLDVAEKDAKNPRVEVRIRNDQ